MSALGRRCLPTQQKAAPQLGDDRLIIASMRLVSDVDWTELVERVSLFDDVLQSGSDFSSLFLGSALLLWREQFRERVAQFR
jgi:hypothetical protein